MYLYKYVSVDILEKIVEKNMVRFTQTCRLNDPYEGHIYVDASIELELEPDFQKQIDSGEIIAPEIYNAQVASLKTDPSRLECCLAKSKEAIENKYGVLSLSRNPYSLLMWAHYADNHKGCVIEFDPQKLPSRTTFGDVLFDIENGTVIYSSIKGENFIKPKLISSQIGLTLTHGQDRDLSCLINKSIDWSYEEEVRIIRDLSMENHDESLEIEGTGEKVFLYKLAQAL